MNSTGHSKDEARTFDMLDSSNVIDHAFFSDENTNTPFVKSTYSSISQKEQIKWPFMNPALNLRETIREWWKGIVLSINAQENSFVSELIDLRGNRSIVEFDSAFITEDKGPIDNFIDIGDEFAYYVVTRHTKMAPETVSKIEFSSPHIWQASDDKKAEKFIDTYFKGDPDFND
ncbi:MAG: hypothetical protein KKA60_14740 [Proteobacteria bacterium]|nr:hypothetical protein [Pseudomonadota bacterium]